QRCNREDPQGQVDDVGPQLGKGFAIDSCRYVDQLARVDFDPRCDEMDVEDRDADSNCGGDVVALGDLSLLARVPELLRRGWKRFFFAALIHGSASLVRRPGIGMDRTQEIMRR